MDEAAGGTSGRLGARVVRDLRRARAPEGPSPWAIAADEAAPGAEADTGPEASLGSEAGSGSASATTSGSAWAAGAASGAAAGSEAEAESRSAAASESAAASAAESRSAAEAASTAAAASESASTAAAESRSASGSPSPPPSPSPSPDAPPASPSPATLSRTGALSGPVSPKGSTFTSGSTSGSTPPSSHSLDGDLPVAVAELVAQGQHAAAADLARSLGHPAAAVRLYEQIWDFGKAALTARSAGDLPRALRAAVSARDEGLIAELVAELSRDEAAQLTTAELLVQLRRFAEAAQLFEARGELEQAAAAYLRAHKDLDAARLYQALGQDRRAGQLLERTLGLASGDERPQIQLALGRLLARRGAHAEAATYLQEARAAAAHRDEATLELIAVLAALGMRDGARDLLVELRRTQPELAPDLDGFLRAWRDRPESRAASREPDLVGGRYRLDRLLGSGGSGRVFLATDEVSGRQVAVKMFFAVDARGGAAFERFAREAQLSQTLRHPSLVEVYEVSIDLGFLVMELLHGGSLAQRLAQGDRLSGQQVRRMALELVDGLSAAHHRGIIHRDVKPANVFFDSRGTAKLGDFGVAHLVDLGQTQTGGLIGTLAYMSPEQITGAPITIAADLYCLGVTLFEALTGRLPFLGPDFVAQHLGEAPVAPTEVDPTIAPAWNPVLARLLMKNPAERTGSLVELRAELETLDLAGRALPLQGASGRPAAPAAAPAEESAGAPAAAEPAARYQFETPVGQTSLSQLVRAVDTVLARSVILERFDATDEATAVMERVRLLARAHTPFLQRALSFDRLSRVAVFEAPSGASLAERKPQLSAAEIVRVLKRLARGIAAVHELGGWHGGIHLASVVLDEANVPTILSSGLSSSLASGLSSGPASGLSSSPASGLSSSPASALGPDERGSASKDVAAVIAVVAHLLGCPPTLAAVAAALCATVGAPVPPALLAPPPEDGEALYAAADVLDIAVLTALGAR